MKRLRISDLGLGLAKRRATTLVAFLALVLSGVSAQALAEEPLKKVPVQVTSDKLDYDRAKDVYVAEGHVKIDQEAMHLEADKVVLNNKTGEATAEGHVYLRDKGDIIRADKLNINVQTKSGVIANGDLFMAKDNYHLKGERIERRSENVYHVENGRFTTCDEEDWYLQADVLDVDMDRYATGNGVSFKMAGLPLFYTPYLLFPVKRQSGLMIPEPGYSSKDGFTIKNSVFWALTDSKDITFYSDYRARTGHGTGIEYRYVNSRDSSGKAYYNYFDEFGPMGSRWEFTYEHKEEFAEDLSMRADINLVSDEFYFRDLEKKLELRSRPYLDSNAFYVERWDTASLYLLGQYAIDLTQSNEKTIQKVPELRYTIYEEALAGPIHLNFEGSAVNFSRQEGDGVRRASLNPQLTAAFGGGGVGFTPRVGGRATFYDVGLNTHEPAELKYYYAGADVNARFSRVYGVDSEAGIGRIRHSIEPTLSYSYIPNVEQQNKNIPPLDTLEDVVKQNLVTAALTNRLTAHYKDSVGSKTYDIMVLRLSQSYDISEMMKTDAAVTHPRSVIRGDLFFKTPTLLTISAGGSYDPYIDRRSSSSESVSVTTEPVRFDISHRYLRDPKTQFLIAGTGFKLAKWDLSAQVWRDVENRKTTQEEYKAHYASQCWGLGLSYITKPGETQYLFLLELKGLGAVKVK